MNEKYYKERGIYPNGPNKILNNSPSAGYGVTKPSKSADQSKTWNVSLITHDNVVIKLWAEDVKMDFSMAGSTGQSRFRKQFYPKSMNQPQITIMGRMPNQYEYNRLAFFIRENHGKALLNVQHKAPAGQTTVVPPTVKMFIRSSARRSKRSAKGGHKMHSFEGYISSIDAGAEKFNFAPTFTFKFIPLMSKLTGSTGLYEDTLLTKGIQILSYMDMFNKNKVAWGVQGADDFASQDAAAAEAAKEIDSYNATNPVPQTEYPQPQPTTDEPPTDSNQPPIQ